MKKSIPAKKATKVINQPPGNRDISKILYFVIIVFTIILYGNTLYNDYALDDLYAITGNKIVQKGVAGIPQLLTTDFFTGIYGDMKIMLTGGRYRPLSLVTFAIEYQFYGQNPGMSHFWNIIFYTLSACLIFAFLKKLFREKSIDKWYLSIPFIATLLFIAHPVHTEVVANIKGRDEILSLMGSVAAGLFYFNFLESKKFKNLIYSFICFFLACMSKENAILFIVFIPLAVYFFRDFDRRDNLLAISPLLLAGLIFFLIRWSVIGNINGPPSTELLDNPFVNANISQRYATIMFTLGMYIKLLVFPHPLTWDYYPYQIQLMNWTDISVILSFVFYLTIFIIAILGFRKKSVFSFTIWVYLIGIFLVSNIIFQIGVFMAERFLYMPSLAFCILIAWLIVKRLIPVFQGHGRGKLVMAGLLSVILLLYSIKTISRNTVWKENYTLYTTDAETSVNSAKGNNLAGQWYAWASNQPANAKDRDTLLQKAHEKVSKALKIYPGYQDAWFRLGNIVFDYKHDADSTVNCYLRILRKNPNEENVFANLNIVINSSEDKKLKIRLWEKIWEVSPKRYEPNFYLANFYFDSDLSKSIAFAEKAREARPDDAPNLKVLASAYLNQSQFEKALPVYDQYLKVNPTDTIMRATRRKIVEYLKNPY